MRGGSPRFSVTLQTGKSIFVYVGDAPNFTSCAAGDTGNLIDDQDLRVDTSQIGGAFYDTWANAKVLTGGQTVTEIDFVVDSGWFFTDKSQEVLVKSVTVNGDTYPGATSVTSPTDKDECKKDGWKTFKNADGSLMFKNQGDCVSFVATGGKNHRPGASLTTTMRMNTMTMGSDVARPPIVGMSGIRARNPGVVDGLSTVQRGHDTVRAIDLQESFWKIRPSSLRVEGRRITEHYLTIYSPDYLYSHDVGQNA